MRISNAFGVGTLASERAKKNNTKSRVTQHKGNDQYVPHGAMSESYAETDAPPGTD